jgi:hypothetical protein
MKKYNKTIAADEVHSYEAQHRNRPNPRLRRQNRNRHSWGIFWAYT